MNGPRLAMLWDGALFVALAPVWVPVNLGVWFYLWAMDAEENDRAFNETPLYVNRMEDGAVQKNSGAPGRLNPENNFWGAA